MRLITMSRRTKFKKKIIGPDSIYNSKLANMLINKIIIKGKKNLAEKIFYKSMENIKEYNKQDPLETLKKAVKNITPTVEIKTRRIGGAIFQVPTEIKSIRGNSLALKFLIKSARNRPGKNIITKLQNEIIDASNNIGNSVKKKEEIHKMAEANKTFTSFK